MAFQTKTTEFTVQNLMASVAFTEWGWGRSAFSLFGRTYTVCDVCSQMFTNSPAALWGHQLVGDSMLTRLAVQTSGLPRRAIRPEREHSRPLAAAGRTAPSVDGALASSAFSRCVRRKTRAAHDKTTNMCARLAVSNDIVTSACAFPLETQ